MKLVDDWKKQREQKKKGREQAEKDREWSKSITGIKFTIPNSQDFARLEKIVLDRLKELGEGLEELKRIIDTKVDKGDSLDS